MTLQYFVHSLKCVIYGENGCCQVRFILNSLNTACRSQSSKSFWNSQLCFPRLSVSSNLTEMRCGLKRTWSRTTEQGCVSANTLTMHCACPGQLLTHNLTYTHMLSGDKVTPSPCIWGLIQYTKRPHSHTTSHWFVCLCDLSHGHGCFCLFFSPSERPSYGTVDICCVMGNQGNFSSSTNKLIFVWNDQF